MCVPRAANTPHLPASLPPCPCFAAVAACLTPACPGRAAALLMSCSISLRVLLAVRAQGLSRLSSAPRFQSLPREMEGSGAARPGKSSKDSLRLTLPVLLLSPAFPRTGNFRDSHPSFPHPGASAFPHLWGKSSFSREIAQNRQGASIPTALECVPPLMAGGQRAEIWEKKIIKKKKGRERDAREREEKKIRAIQAGAFLNLYKIQFTFPASLGRRSHST